MSKIQSVPVDDCLVCKHYDDCEKFTSGKCLIREMQTVKKKGYRARYEYGGYVLSCHEWADFLGINYSTLYSRVAKQGIGVIGTAYKKEFEDATKRK